MRTITVERLIQGTLIREGAGVKLYRYIGVERSNNFEPFLLLDYFDSHDPLDFIAGFPPHPHRGFETITYLFAGSITHEDNKGHKGTIGPGDVQWMTAGKGIIHSEMPSASSERLHGLQLWLNLPAAEKMHPPRYQDMLSAQFPLEHTVDGGIIKVIAGQTDKGTTSPIVDIATQPLFLDLQLPAGAVYTQHITADYQALLFVIEGSMQVEGLAIPAAHMAQLSAGTELTLTATQSSHCLLLAARKLHEPIARHGPFVMNHSEEIVQALDDFRQGTF